MVDTNNFLTKLQNIYNTSGRNTVIDYILSQLRDNSLKDDQRNELKFYLGREYFFQNDFDKAENIFNELLSLNNNNNGAKIYLSEILYKKNKIIDSVYLLNDVYRSNPDKKYLLEVISERISELNNVNNSKYSYRENGKTEQFPLISIIILYYNKSEMTKQCLKTLFGNTDYPNYEVIVLDNASVDDTAEIMLSYGKKIKFIRAEKNLGFVGGNNFATDFANGDFLVFLNNDTEPQKGWLKNLYSTFEYYKDAGAAGSMLIYPNGKLQEAGGVIFNDATGWNYGRGDDPKNSKYSYCREVDYCSGAALMIRKSLFEEIGRFDNRFAPAYYEDTDLCFSVRKFGYKVYFNPFSKVVHHEGATAGTDLNSGFKRFQVVNHPKFVEKWKEELAKQYPNNSKLRYKFSDRNKGKRVLIIDDIPPLPDRASGAKDHYQMLLQMLDLGCKITYVHLMGKQYMDESGIKYFTDFKMRGVEFIWFNYEFWYPFRNTDTAKSYVNSLINSLDLEDRNFDLVYIAFWHIAEYFIDLIRHTIPNVPIIVDSVDIHYIRELRQAKLLKDNSLLQKALKNKKRELMVYEKADCVKVVTLTDKNDLCSYLKNKSIIIMTGVFDSYNSKITFEDRSDFLFVGNFNHNPNVDAIIYFVNEIFPIIQKQLPNVKLYIVGNNPPKEITKLASEKIIVTGWVPDIKPYLEKCRVSVVPLRYGAGYKGKVCETLSFGLPMVATTIACEGIGVVNDIHSFVADDALSFANYAIELYTNKAKWEKFSQNGKKLIDSEFSSKILRKRVKYMLSFNSRKAFQSYIAINYSEPPRVSFIIIVFNQVDYTIKCLESIKKFVKISHEIILIDNASDDGTLDIFTEKINYVRYFRNKENVGFPAAVNQGINEALGDYVLVLNNDTILTESMVERLTEIAESDDKIGIVGPISNEVSGLQKDNNAKYNSIEEMHKYAAEVQQKNKGEILHFPRVAFLCTLIKSEVIDKIGGLDERFSPGNFEDDDFCLRAQLAGYKTVIAKDVFIHHYGSKSFKANGLEEYKKRLEINRQIFIDKWGADPDEIWLKNKPIKKHQIYYPIDKNLFKQHLERTRILIADNEINLAQIEIEKAIDSFDEKSGELISYTELLNLAGNLFLATNDFEKAKSYFEKELETNPSSSSACFGLGQIFFAQENYEAAKVMFEWAIKNDSQNQQAINSLQNVNEILGLEINHNSLLELNNA
jgi:GT2 family glycosyltransferase/glycosyltransferase involved in cell wall biosynthesis/thioredoxin-like negative regulator of GroEL